MMVGECVQCIGFVGVGVVGECYFCFLVGGQLVDVMGSEYELCVLKWIGRYGNGLIGQGGMVIILWFLFKVSCVVVLWQYLQFFRR